MKIEERKNTINNAETTDFGKIPMLTSSTNKNGLGSTLQGKNKPIMKKLGSLHNI